MLRTVAILADSRISLKSLVFCIALFGAGAPLAAQQPGDYFPSGVVLDDNWMNVDPMGEVYIAHFPWMYTQTHGWWYADGSNESSMWLYDGDLGWIWTSLAVYPNLFCAEWQEWYAYESGIGEQRQFYNYWTQSQQTGPTSVESSLNARMEALMALSEDKLRDTISTVRNASNFPRDTRKGGAYGHWLTRESDNWTSGFFPGLLWLMYAYTADSYWQNQVERWLTYLEQEKYNTGTHDIGFMIGIPYMWGYLLTGEDDYRDVVVKASESLATRFNTETVGAMRSWSWGQHGEGNNFTVIIDNMMNLEMLYWASAQDGGETEWSTASTTHALTTAREHIREDGSTYHVVIFNEDTGEVKSRETHQGYNDESTWSRGQAWGLYGFTTTYRLTGDARFLETARDLAAYFMNHLSSDGLPAYDFETPQGLDGTPKDTSAAAIYASALLELSALAPDTVNAHEYRRAAEAMLLNLTRPGVLSKDMDDQPLLLQGSGARGSHEMALIYGDYYLVEAALRYLNVIPYGDDLTL